MSQPNITQNHHQSQQLQQQQQKEQQQPTAKQESDDVEVVVLLKTVTKSVVPVQHQSTTDIDQSIKDYDPNCPCNICIAFKKVFDHFEKNPCKCKECQPHLHETVEKQDSVQQQYLVNEPQNSNDVELKTEMNQPGTSMQLDTEQDDDDINYSRSSTPDYVPKFFDDDSEEENDDDDEIEEEENANPQDSIYKQENQQRTESHSSLQDMPMDIFSTSCIEPTAPEGVCPKCGRIYKRKHFLRSHIESHSKGGYQCIWPNCGYFYTMSSITVAKKHLCRDHGCTNMKEADIYLALVDSAANNKSGKSIGDLKLELFLTVCGLLPEN